MDFKLAFVALIATVALAIIFNVVRRKREKKMEDLISQLVASASKQTTVVGGVVTFIKGQVAALKAATDQLANEGADVTKLQGIVSAIDENTADIATAIAVDTPASGEVHTDDGGTGTAPAATDGGGGDTSGTVVDPAAVDTTNVEQAATDAVTDPPAA